MTSVNVLTAGPVVLPERHTARDVLLGVAAVLHAPDERWAWAHGLTTTRVGTSRVYRSPQFDQRRALVEEATR